MKATDLELLRRKLETKSFHVEPDKNLLIGAILEIVKGKKTVMFNVVSAPTNPKDGEMWLQDNTNRGLKIRINGVTKTVTLS